MVPYRRMLSHFNGLITTGPCDQLGTDENLHICFCYSLNYKQSIANFGSFFWDLIGPRAVHLKKVTPVSKCQFQGRGTTFLLKLDVPRLECIQNIHLQVKQKQIQAS